MNVVMTGVGPVRRGAGHGRGHRVLPRRARRRCSASPRAASARSSRCRTSCWPIRRCPVDATREARPRVGQPGQGRRDRRRSVEPARRRRSRPGPPTLPDVVETADTLEGNARLKAVAVARGDRACPRSPTTPASRSTRSAARRACARPATRASDATYADNVAKLLDALDDVPPGAPHGALPHGRDGVLARRPRGRRGGRGRRAASRMRAARRPWVRLRPGVRPRRGRRPHVRRDVGRREARAVTPRAGVAGPRRRSCAELTSLGGRSPTCRSPRRRA